MSASFYTINPRNSTSYSGRQSIHTKRAGTTNTGPHDKSTSSQPTTAATSSARFQSSSSRDHRHSSSGVTEEVYHSSSEWAIFSFDEELERQLRHEKEAAPIFHVGRGSSRNMMHTGGYRFTRKPSETSSIGSDSTTDSDSDRPTDKTRRNIGKGWKMAGLSS